MKGMALAPSKHLRLLTLLLGATLALSSCGAQQAGTAATVDGTVISEKDTQAVALELAPLAQGQQPISPGVVLSNMILAPFVLAEAGKNAPDDAQVRKAIAKVANPSPRTMDVVRTNLAIQSLSPESKTTILAKLGKAKIIVNPRYGAFDIKQVAVLPLSPNWIKAGPASAAK
jgi:hypothetical protein